LKIRNLSYPVIILAAFLTVFFTNPAYNVRGKYLEETISHLGNLPTELLQSVSLEFKGVIADFLLMKTISFMGMKIVEQENPDKEEWQRINQMLIRITDLDGRFRDPYVLAEMSFVWQAGMIDEANILLEKAVKNRPDDYTPLYFLGFNHFYFLNDAEKAAVYLRQAALKPNAPDYVKGLAARFSLYSKQTALGILFLENLLQDTQDKNIRMYLEKRLTALEIIDSLEKTVIAFRESFQQMPTSLDDLVRSGLLENIPADPYGGTFFLMDNGRIYTTSKLVAPLKK
jgi:tetratricopeptide (TPR) repeat protein